MLHKTTGVSWNENGFYLHKRRFVQLFYIHLDLTQLCWSQKHLELTSNAVAAVSYIHISYKMIAIGLHVRYINDQMAILNYSFVVRHEVVVGFLLRCGRRRC